MGLLNPIKGKSCKALAYKDMPVQLFEEEANMVKFDGQVLAKNNFLVSFLVTEVKVSI